MCHKRHQQSICSQHTDQAESSSEIKKDTATLNSNTEKIILLQTAQSIACNPRNGCSWMVCILFDNGSQRSYVTDEHRHQLKLKRDHHEILQLNTFGDRQHKVTGCDVIQLNIRKANSSDTVKLEALCFPTICTDQLT